MLAASSNLSENAKEPPDLDHLAGITLISLVVFWQTQHAGIAARSCAFGDRVTYPWSNSKVDLGDWCGSATRSASQVKGSSKSGEFWKTLIHVKPRAIQQVSVHRYLPSNTPLPFMSSPCLCCSACLTKDDL